MMNAELKRAGYPVPAAVLTVGLTASAWAESPVPERPKSDQHPESISPGKGCEDRLKILNSIILTTRRNSISSNPHSRLSTQHSELLEDGGSP